MFKQYCNEGRYVGTISWKFWQFTFPLMVYENVVYFIIISISFNAKHFPLLLNVSLDLYRYILIQISEGSISELQPCSLFFFSLEASVGWFYFNTSICHLGLLYVQKAHLCISPAFKTERPFCHPESMVSLLVPCSVIAFCSTDGPQKNLPRKGENSCFSFSGTPTVLLHHHEGHRTLWAAALTLCKSSWLLHTAED